MTSFSVGSHFRKFLLLVQKSQGRSPVCVALEPTGPIRGVRATAATSDHDAGLSVRLRLPKGTAIIDGVDEALLHGLIEATQ
jgi:hypothetical protein